MSRDNVQWEITLFHGISFVITMRFPSCTRTTAIISLLFCDCKIVAILVALVASYS